MSDILTKDQLSEIVRMQLIYEKNTDVRPFFEIVKDIPSKAAKNINIQYIETSWTDSNCLGPPENFV